MSPKKHGLYQTSVLFVVNTFGSGHFAMRPTQLGNIPSPLLRQTVAYSQIGAYMQFVPNQIIQNEQN
jgi:hypothetical protein